MSDKVSLSQENLFFPLPFTSATIENIIKVVNKLPPVSGDPTQNILSFKVLSVVRHRYSVKPAVGFIAPGKSLTISFSLDPEAIKKEKDPQARVLPTKDTKDAVYIDIITVDPSVAANKKFLQKFEAAEDERMSSAIQQDASAFWKTVSAKLQQKPAGAPETHASNNVPEGVERLRLRCIFNSRDQVPDTLVMQLKHGHSAESTPVSAPRVPPTRAPPSVANRDSTAPPEFPPRRSSVAASLSHRNSVVSRASTVETAATPTTPAKPAAAPSPVSAKPEVAAPAKLAPAAATPAAPAAPAAGGGGALSSIRAKMQHAATSASSNGGSEGKKLSLKSVLNYKISYKYCAVLLFLTLLCGLFDSHNVLTWLLAGK